MTAYNPEPKDININSSAAELRNYTLAFVSFLLYVLITAASTTHEQLLRISAVKLPLLDIDIPIVQFYLVSPLLILILHFHLLLQHFLFSQQFYSFDAALKLQYPDHADRVRFMKGLSGNLSLVHLLGGYQKTAVQVLLAVILAICLLIFPLFDLWFLQARFLPFHNNDYTNWQVLMVVMDCVILLALLPKTFDEQDNALRWWLSVFSPLWWFKRFYFYGLRRFYHLSYQRGSLRFFNRVLLNKATIKAKLKKLMPQYQAVLHIRIISFKQFLAIVGSFSFVMIIFLLSVFISTLPAFEDENKDSFFINDREKWVINHLPDCKHNERWEYDFKQVITNACKIKLVRKNRATKTIYDRWVFIFTAVLHEEINKDEKPFLFRNLNLTEKIITADENLSRELENTLDEENTIKKISGINLKGRDLRYADFSNSKLPKADFRNSSLQNAKFNSSYLRGSHLEFSNLKAAKLNYANLQSCHFNSANLESAKLDYADLKFAYLIPNKLENILKENKQPYHLDYDYSNTDSVNLKNSSLYSADLEGANLMYANLENADLDSAILRNTNFKNTNLKYADLDSSDLRNASLDDAHLEHASLSNKRSGFNEVGLDLNDANLQGASLIGAHLVNANLRQANLQGTNLRYADLKKANLRGIKVRGANLQGVNLEGSQRVSNFIEAYRENTSSDKKRLGEVINYWINDLACSDKWTAQGIIRNYFFDTNEFKTYLIPLLKKKLTDKDCLGIQNLSNDFKQQIKDAIKQQ